jgi:hypothetical protein
MLQLARFSVTSAEPRIWRWPEMALAIGDSDSVVPRNLRIAPAVLVEKERRCRARLQTDPGHPFVPGAGLSPAECRPRDVIRHSPPPAPEHGHPAKTSGRLFPLPDLSGEHCQSRRVIQQHDARSRLERYQENRASFAPIVAVGQAHTGRSATEWVAVSLNGLHPKRRTSPCAESVTASSGARLARQSARFTRVSQLRDPGSTKMTWPIAAMLKVAQPLFSSVHSIAC